MNLGAQPCCTAFLLEPTRVFTLCLCTSRSAEDARTDPFSTHRLPALMKPRKVIRGRTQSLLAAEFTSSAAIDVVLTSHLGEQPPYPG